MECICNYFHSHTEKREYFLRSLLHEMVYCNQVNKFPYHKENNSLFLYKESTHTSVLLFTSLHLVVVLSDSNCWKSDSDILSSDYKLMKFGLRTLKIKEYDSSKDLYFWRNIFYLKKKIKNRLISSSQP